MGNEDAAQRRLAAIDDLPLLDLTLDVDELARVFGYDIKKILADARDRQKSSGRLIISPPAMADS